MPRTTGLMSRTSRTDALDIRKNDIIRPDKSRDDEKCRLGTACIELGVLNVIFARSTRLTRVKRVRRAFCALDACQTGLSRVLNMFDGHV